MEVEIPRYQRPKSYPQHNNGPATHLLNAGTAKILEFGSIALPAEGQPVRFRNIQLKSLETP
jgi:hypothetical protein